MASRFDAIVICIEQSGPARAVHSHPDVAELIRTILGERAPTPGT